MTAELEERICLCGCKKKFKCFPNSNALYFSHGHDPDYKQHFHLTKVYRADYRVDKIMRIDRNQTEGELIYYDGLADPVQEATSDSRIAPFVERPESDRNRPG